MKVSRIVIILFLAATLFIGWVLIKPALFKGKEAMTDQQEPAQPALPERTVAPAGPASPSQLPPSSSEETVLYGPPGASDPYYQSEGSSAHEERLRHPERMFQPATRPETSDIAVDGGIASFRGVASGRDAAQMFSPEMAQNGGEFMDGIVANDGGLGNFSSI